MARGWTTSGRSETTHDGRRIPGRPGPVRTCPHRTAGREERPRRSRTRTRRCQRRPGHARRTPAAGGSIMSDYKLALLGIYVLFLLITIGIIGKQPEPLTPRAAAIPAIITGL